MAANSGPLRLFRPQIDDSASAKAAARLGATGAAIIPIVEGITLAIDAIRFGSLPDSVPLGSCVDALLLGFIAFGTWSLWRWTDVAALALFLLGQLVAAILQGRMVGFVMPLAIGLFLLSGVRGTFAHAKYAREQAAHG
ncbi:MAG: hypothetical protein DIU56_015485 [Pseudomonadota bacterium]|jgi:hypothetical protein